MSGGASTKDDPSVTLSGGDKTKREQPPRAFTVENTNDSALDGAEDELHDLEVDLSMNGRQEDTPKQEASPQKQEN